jgi:tetratricopeptide (TPR) repeat protein
LAWVYAESGDLKKGLSLAEQTYKSFKISKASGKLYPQLGEEKNEGDGFLSLSAMKKFMFELAESGLLTQLASIYHKSGKLNKALNLAEKAYYISQNISFPIPIANKAFRKRKNLPPLPKNYKKNNKQFITPGLLHTLGIIHRDLGHSDKALSLLEESYHLDEKQKSQRPKGKGAYTSLKIRNDLAALYVKQGQIQKGIEHFEKLVAHVENYRGDLSAENRQSLFQEWVKSYFTLSQLYIRQSRYKDGFRIAEMSKARTLLESLVAKFAIEQGGLNPADQKKWHDYNTRITALNTQIANALASKAKTEKILGFEA